MRLPRGLNLQRSVKLHVQGFKVLESRALVFWRLDLQILNFKNPVMDDSQWPRTALIQTATIP